MNAKYYLVYRMQYKDLELINVVIILAKWYINKQNQCFTNKACKFQTFIFILYKEKLYFLKCFLKKIL